LLTHCYHEIVTVRFLHIVVDIRLAVNNIEVLSVAMGKKQPISLHCCQKLRNICYCCQQFRPKCSLLRLSCNISDVSVRL